MPSLDRVTVIINDIRTTNEYFSLVFFLVIMSLFLKLLSKIAFFPKGSFRYVKLFFQAVFLQE